MLARIVATKTMQVDVGGVLLLIVCGLILLFIVEYIRTIKR